MFVGNKSIASDGVMEKATQATQKVSAGYLDSKKSVFEFGQLVKSMKNSSSADVMSAWEKSLKEKGITGDQILPSRIENVFFKAWVDNASALSFTRFINVKAFTAYAETLGANKTAKAHLKGQDKVNQDIVQIRRAVRAIAMYKKLELDLQDIFDDETGELLTFRVEELASRIANQILVAIVLGGEQDGSAKKTGNTDNRGFFGIADDAEAIIGTYGSFVVENIAGEANDSNYDIAIKVANSIRGNGSKTIFVGEGFKRDLLLTKNITGVYQFQAGTNVEETIGLRIVEMPEITDGKVYGVLDGAYVVIGEANATTRTAFDLTKNQDVMLVERFVGGSLQGFKTGAVYTPAA